MAVLKVYTLSCMSFDLFQRVDVRAALRKARSISYPNLFVLRLFVPYASLTVHDPVALTLIPTLALNSNTNI